MPWTDAALAAAFNALSPVPATLADAVPLLNAQTTNQAVDVPVGSLYGAMLLNGAWAQMGDWAKANSNDTTTLPLIQSLQAMLTSPNIASVQMTNPATAQAVQGMLKQLVAGGAITATQQAELLAMASQTVPAWSPSPICADLQRCQRAGLISASIPPYPGYVAP